MVEWQMFPIVFRSSTLMKLFANSLVFEDMCFEWAISDPVVDSEVKEVGDLLSDGSGEN
jgi:hypothetical protein